ncbi:MAG TPA: site-2 protease family protein, partial [Verrucomicrobiales bacterium]|nr:site-2 protease family protein [Verrucomicrobiales bacterium]
PAGRIAGISIRIHLLFFIYVISRIIEFNKIEAIGGYSAVFGLSLFAGLYVCILLHEFGHALTARWCGGQADEILIWPLGGLAYCSPPLNPTPHLLTTLGGPFVTLVIWAVLSPLAYFITPDFTHEVSGFHKWSWFYIDSLADINLSLLLFNLVPAFPMDGGRALRDTLWHYMPVQKANRIASVTGIIACIVLISWGISSQNQMMVFIGIFAIFGAAQEFASYQYVEPWQIEHWSLRDRLGLGERRTRPAAKAAKPAKRAWRNRQPKDPLPYESKLAPRLDVSPDRQPVQKIDAILEKISRTGLESLDEWERLELDRASKELNRQDR